MTREIGGQLSHCSEFFHPYAADAGEEELLLDALSICGDALACLGAFLAPDALLARDLLPEEASLDARRPPYHLRLTLHKVNPAA